MTFDAVMILVVLLGAVVLPLHAAYLMGKRVGRFRMRSHHFKEWEWPIEMTVRQKEGQ